MTNNQINTLIIVLGLKPTRKEGFKSWINTGFGWKTLEGLKATINAILENGYPTSTDEELKKYWEQF